MIKSLKLKMKLEIMCLLVLAAYAGNNTKRLEKENEQLRDENKILHKQLLQLAQLGDLTEQIKDDFNYNKQKLRALITEYWSEEDAVVRTMLAEEILDYTRALLEDANLLGGNVEGVNSDELVETLKELKES
jgi:hypothetical protein